MTRTILPTSCQRLPIALSVVLLGACLANLALVCIWLVDAAANPSIIP